MSKKKRTLVKTITWRITATLTTMILVWIFTGRIDFALSIGGVEVFLKMFLYYIHERTWDSISWARD